MLKLTCYKSSPSNAADNNNKRNIKRNKAKNTLATAALPAATPVKPNKPATMDMIKNTRAQYNIHSPPVLYGSIIALLFNPWSVKAFKLLNYRRINK